MVSVLFLVQAVIRIKINIRSHANVRNDGTSRIANDENKNIATWSTGVLWNAIGEDFVKRIGFLTDLKVRASYGSVPNIGSISTGSFGAGGGLVSVPNYLGPQVPAYGSTTYAGSALSAQAPASAYNPNLKIETIRKLNVGADFAVWKSRARFSFDYYNDKTEDLFVSLALPSTSGFGNNTIPINAGIMRNSGVEMVVAVDIIKKNNMDLTFSIKPCN
jgi:outer membrane receptor protein involved in Fe transport